jgi:hypothetical protein
MWKSLDAKPEGTTQFQVYQEFEDKNIIDLTYKRIEKLIKESISEDIKKTFEALLSGYLNGKLMVGWTSNTKPIFKHIHKNKT